MQRSLFMCSKSLDSKGLTEHRPLPPSHLFELAFPLPLIKCSLLANPLTGLWASVSFSPRVGEGSGWRGCKWVSFLSITCWKGGTRWRAGTEAPWGAESASPALQCKRKPRITQVLESRDCRQSPAALFTAWKQACLRASAWKCGKGNVVPQHSGGLWTTSRCLGSRVLGPV